MHPKYFKIYTLFVLLFSLLAVFARDPTQPAQFQGKLLKSNVGLVVSGIFGSKGKYSVVINGQNLKVGDKIDGFTVTTISRTKVTLESGTGKTKTVEVGGNSDSVKVKVSGI